MQIQFSGEADDTFYNIMWNVMRGFTVRVHLEGNEVGFDAEIQDDGFLPVDEAGRPTGEDPSFPPEQEIANIYVY